MVVKVDTVVGGSRQCLIQAEVRTGAGKTTRLASLGSCRGHKSVTLQTTKSNSYRAREKYKAEDTWKKWALDKVPDPVENFWNYLNEPTSTAPSRTVDEAYKASGGSPLSFPAFMGQNIPIPESVGRFMGSMADDQTSRLNIGLNALTLGGYAGVSGLGGAAKTGLTTLGRLGARAQMGAGAVGLGAGGINAADALSKGEDATWGDYGNAALQAGLGAFNIWGGKGDLDAMTPRPKPGVITDPARLLGPGAPPPPPPTGARFEAGPSGIGDLSDPNYVPGSAGARPPVTPDPGPAGDISIAGLGDVAPPDLPLNVAPEAATRLQTFEHDPTVWPQFKPPVDPRSPSGFAPFEQDPGIFQQMRQGPSGEPIDLAAHQIQDPVVPNTSLDGPGTSRPASDFWRTVVAEGAPPPTPRAVSALGAVEPPNIPDVKPPIESLSPDLEADMQLIVDRGEFTLDDLGHDPDKIHAYAEIIRGSDGAPVGSHPDDIAAVQAEAAAAPAPVGPANIDAGPAATSMAPAAPTPAPALPTPVAPVRDAASRVAVMPDKPLVRPKVPGKPTPDRVIRIGRGVHDAVRAIFPDKLHVDLFSALGRAKRQMRGEKGGIAPNYEGLAEQLGVSLKEAHRIADEYRLKVLKLTKEAPGLGPEGSDVVDIEMPHWGGKAPEMVSAAPTPAPVAAAPVAAPVAAATPNPAAELNAALAARGAAPIPEKAPTTALPKSKNARVRLVMEKLTSGGGDLAAVVDDPAKLLATAKAAGIKSGTLKSAIQEWFKKAGGSETGGLKVGPSDKRMKQLGEFHKQFMEKIRAGIPDARERGELDNAIVNIYKEMNPGLKLEPGNARAKRALDLVRAVRVKNPASSTGKWVLKDIPDHVVEASRKIRELTYGKLKMEKEDIINHYLDTGKVEMPEPDFDTSDPHLSKVQSWFKKQGGSDTGALSLPSKAQLQAGWDKAFEAANQVRMTSMLSGLALPKSLAGNLGAHLAAAFEGKTIKPLMVLTNYKAIARDIAIGWKGHANPAMVTGMGKFNLPGRLMGAADFASIASLQRAGLSEKAAKELLLTGSNPVSAWPILGSKMGKLLVPFRTTPFNQFAQGMTRWMKHPDVGVAVVTLGYLAGKQTKEPEEIAMMSALAGPYALPFLVGASWSAGGEVLSGISPIPEWGITKTIQNPFAAFTESPGRRWFRPGAGFGEAAKKEKQKEALVRRRAKRKAEREAARQ